MKCTYRVLMLIGITIGVLLMLGINGDLPRILEIRAPSPQSESGSLRSEGKGDFLNGTLLFSDANKRRPSLSNNESLVKLTPDALSKSYGIGQRLGRGSKLKDAVASSKRRSSLIPSLEASYDRLVLAVVCCGSRINETLIMLKSAAALSHSPLTVIVFTEDSQKPVFVQMHASWPSDIRERVTLTLHSITYPPGQDSKTWRKLFKPCASQRLFMPSLLEDIDSLIYVDTDVLFLAPLEELWKHFSAMNSSQMAAMAPEHEDLATGWYNRFAKHPYYGRLGVNSGVMLMNLTRLRKFGWEDYVIPIYKHYKLSITWGDQDIINIIFHYHPDKLYVYGCEYNLRPDHCMYMSVCKAAEKRGIYVLHGNRGTFHSDKQPAFRAVYRAWEEYHLGEDLRQELYYPMQRYLLKVSNTTCGKIYNAFLKNIGSRVRLR
ncbi:glucoside xylosyltransferase 1-like [Palaemon carinicauda]|uniref:glucoside xylosyltransferase 1-like n=1 Tax=Palaemon carinicauda TaxID=392227 RepID=UPI0035B5E6F5